MHVFGIDDCARIKKQLNSLVGSKGGGSMQWRFTLRSAVAHEAICWAYGAAFYARRAQHSRGAMLSRAAEILARCSGTNCGTRRGEEESVGDQSRSRPIRE
jgi:hypothetical protein